MYHSVPKALASSAEKAEIFQRYWNPFGVPNRCERRSQLASGLASGKEALQERLKTPQDEPRRRKASKLGPTWSQESPKSFKKMLKKC